MRADLRSSLRLSACRHWLLAGPARAFRARQARCRRAAGAGRWSGWAPPISSSARCWRPGPTLSAPSSPARWSICRIACRLFRKTKRAPKSPRAFGKPVEALFSSFGGAAGGRLHRPGAPGPDQRHAAGAGRGQDPAPRRARACSPATWKRWPCSPAWRSAFPAEARRLRLDARWSKPWPPRWRWNWICGWKRRRPSELYERTRGDTEFRVPHVDWTRTAATRADQRMDRWHTGARRRRDCRRRATIPKQVALTW